MIDKEKLAAALHKCSVNGEMRYFAPSNVMEEVDGELFNTLEYAARTLQAIMPLLEEMDKGIKAVSDLIYDSQGIYGLHMNGDVAPWHDLQTGGRFENWLKDFDRAAKNTAEIGKILGGQAQCSLMK